MKYIAILALILTAQFQTLLANDSARPNDVQIARVVRQAVRDAGPELLDSPLLTQWREFLKLAAIDLDMKLQPLVLIKFDEDIAFRHQLKQIIEWENHWEKQETPYYIYYFRWDNPLPELVLEVQDVHFHELCAMFSVEPEEKVAYRYDHKQQPAVVFPPDDLRYGIISPHPFDLEKAAQAFFNCINSDFLYITAPLAKIHGAYFQNQSTALTYYEKCVTEIVTRGYISANDLYRLSEFPSLTSQEWYSAFAFSYKLSEKFGAEKIKNFLELADSEMNPASFSRAFEQVFGQSVVDFEIEQQFQQSASKL